MNSVPSFNDHVSLLLRDPYAAVNGGGDARIIGYVGDDVPVELILAANAVPLRVRGTANAPTPRANEYLESAFMPELRAVAEQWLTGSLDFLDAVVLSRTDDSAQRLYYYMCELQHRGICGGPLPLLYDVGTLPRQTSRAHSLESTRRLAAALGASITQAALQRVARRERLLERLHARRADETPIAGSVAWRMQQASGYDWRSGFDDAAERWLDTAPSLSRPRRILLAGDLPPDERLHLAVEAAGGSIVAERVDSCGPARATHADLMVAIADYFQQRSSVAVSMRMNGRWLADCARAVRADAVLAWLIEEDESLPWEIPRQMRSLAAEGVPSLLLSRQQWRATDETLSQVRTFVATVEPAR
jgi:hypothetical protein